MSLAALPQLSLLHLDLANGSTSGSCRLAATANRAQLSLLYVDQTMETSVMVRGGAFQGLEACLKCPLWQ